MDKGFAGDETWKDGEGSVTEGRDTGPKNDRLSLIHEPVPDSHREALDFTQNQ